MADAPVFYDASGRRRRRFRLAVIAFVLLVVLAAGLFFVSIGAVPRAPLLPFRTEAPALHRLQPPHQSVLTRTRRSLDWYARRLFGTTAAQRSLAPNTPLAIAFHAPWDPSSTASLRRHIDQLDWLVPGWLSVTGADHHTVR
jgi:hypothetical protein